MTQRPTQRAVLRCCTAHGCVWFRATVPSLGNHYDAPLMC